MVISLLIIISYCGFFRSIYSITLLLHHSILFCCSLRKTSSSHVVIITVLTDQIEDEEKILSRLWITGIGFQKSVASLLLDRPLLPLRPVLRIWAVLIPLFSPYRSTDEPHATASTMNLSLFISDLPDVPATVFHSSSCAPSASILSIVHGLLLLQGMSFFLGVFHVCIYIIYAINCDLVSVSFKTILCHSAFSHFILLWVPFEMFIVIFLSDCIELCSLYFLLKMIRTRNPLPWLLLHHLQQDFQRPKEFVELIRFESNNPDEIINFLAPLRRDERWSFRLFRLHSLRGTEGL